MELTDAQIQHKLSQNPLLAQLHAIAMKAVETYERPTNQQYCCLKCGAGFDFGCNCGDDV